MKRRRFLKLMGLTGIGGAAAAGGGIAWGRSRNPYYNGPVSDHFDGVNFFNPEGEAPKGFVELLKWQLGGGRKKWPEAYPSPFSDHPPAKVGSNTIRASFVGHATVLVQTNGFNILTDPVWSERASPVQWAGPKRVSAPGIDFEKLPKIDVVLLSHNHYDHLDLVTLSRLNSRDGTLVVTPLGNDTILKDHDPGIRVTAADWGDRLQPMPGLEIVLEPAHHWSARGLTDRRNALWAAFIVEAGGQRIYHVGDTGFHKGINYRAVAEKYRGIDLAILPFGAYEPRGFMRAQHQNPDEAVQGHLLCGARKTLGHHWGTFQLTNESIDDQLEHLAEARERHGVAEDDFRALRPGEVMEVAGGGNV